MEALLSVLVTAILGSYFAYRWQQRSSKEARFFDASKTRYDQMHRASRDLASMIGKRIYAGHRLSRLSDTNAFFGEAKEDFRQATLEWNRHNLQTELDIRTLFANSAVVDFEQLQGRLAGLSAQVFRHVETCITGTPQAHPLIRQWETLRGDYFTFLQGMIREADNVFKQMHFSVLLRYEQGSIEHFSTSQLAKALLTGPEEESTIVRPPLDFGIPVDIANARLGVN